MALADVGTDAMAVDLETAAVLVTEAALETEVVSEMALMRAMAIRAKEKTSMQTYRSHSMRRPLAGDKRITLTDGHGENKTLQVHIPAGIDTGKSVRLRGKGQPGIGGGQAGDLLLEVTVGSRRATSGKVPTCTRP